MRIHMSTEQRTAWGSGGLLGGKQRSKKKEASIDGKRRGKWEPKLFILPEILGTNRGKVTTFLPFLCPRGHQAAKQLINVVALLWSPESLMDSFLPHKIKI